MRGEEDPSQSKFFLEFFVRYPFFVFPLNHQRRVIITLILLDLFQSHIFIDIKNYGDRLVVFFYYLCFNASPILLTENRPLPECPIIYQPERKDGEAAVSDQRSVFSLRKDLSLHSSSARNCVSVKAG